jgi:hypothetical protein
VVPQTRKRRREMLELAGKILVNKQQFHSVLPVKAAIQPICVPD